MQKLRASHYSLSDYKHRNFFFPFWVVEVHSWLWIMHAYSNSCIELNHWSWCKCSLWINFLIRFFPSVSFCLVDYGLKIGLSTQHRENYFTHVSYCLTPCYQYKILTTQKQLNTFSLAIQNYQIISAIPNPNSKHADTVSVAADISCRQ